MSNVSDYTGSQNKTGDNDRFLRFCWEVSSASVGMGRCWVFYSKGGDYRRWYGNQIWIISIASSAISFYKKNPTSNLLAEKYWFKDGICYTMLTSGKPNFRMFPAIGAFDMAGPEICELGDNLKWVLGFLNSTVACTTLDMLNPTLNLQAKDVKALPLVFVEEIRVVVERLVSGCVLGAKLDWDSFETSWDFKRHPLL